MKKLIARKTREEMLRTHPIISNIEGWFIRIAEPSNNIFLVEATDQYGRIVSKSGSDPDNLVKEVEKEIFEIIFH
ncbi:MAG TPA: hypothetical protein VK892_20910 [Pyrinomonadaceae bacterium]|nr:hypothetical protein [Pyrinomonadaceae bacterium]